MGFEPIQQQDQTPSGFTPFEQPRMLSVSEVPNGEEIIASNNAWLQGIVSPELNNVWKEAGTIGAGEAYTKLNKWEMIPVWNAKTLLDDIPVIQSFNKFRSGEVLSDEDKETMKEYIIDMAEIQTR